MDGNGNGRCVFISDKSYHYIHTEWQTIPVYAAMAIYNSKIQLNKDTNNDF